MMPILPATSTSLRSDLAGWVLAKNETFQMRLRSAILYVKDLQSMKQFYTDMLGVQPTHQEWTDRWVAFDTDGARFALHAIPAEIAQHIEMMSPPTPREENPMKLVFEVKDVESERARLESIGIRTLRRPWQKPGEACDAVDPEGNIIQICSPGADSSSDFL